jgi:hypothetical protein
MADCSRLPVVRRVHSEIAWRHQTAANHLGLNPYELRSGLLAKQEKERNCAENEQPVPIRQTPRFFARYDAKGKSSKTPTDYPPVQVESDAHRGGKPSPHHVGAGREAPSLAIPHPTTSCPPCRGTFHM